MKFHPVKHGLQAARTCLQRDLRNRDRPTAKIYNKLANDKKWPTTNDVAMHRQTLEDFVRWFTPLAMSMGNEKPVGHAFGRAIKRYSILSGRGNSYLGDVLSHFQMNSHETQDFKKDKGVFHRLLAKN